jgi:two-component system phosphate regulon sensor histidine kinase PhoR
MLAALALTSVGLWTLGFAAAKVWSGDAGWLLCVAVAAGLALAALAAALPLKAFCRERLTIERHFDALCQLGPEDLQFDGTVDKVPPLPAGNPWRAMAERVRGKLAENSHQLQDLKHAQAAVEIRSRRAMQQCELIKAILAGVSDPILAVDDFDELMLANPAAEELLGFKADSSEERALARLVRCQTLIELLTSTAHRKTASSRSDEVEIVDTEGRSHWYRASAVKLPGSSGGDAPARGGAVAVLRDIGQQKILQKRNAEFVSSVSHEMKTPLAGIKAYVELLADGEAEDEETREEFLAVINGQADRLQRLVDNLLNLARIEAGVVQVNKQNHSLNEILEEALGVVQPAAETRRIELAGELSPLFLGVLADRDMLLQAAINLLSNAVKYTPEGGRVTLRSRSADDEVAFEVEDTGVGLSEEDCGRVFEKFYRVKKDKDMASGTGLGLPLAKHIVEDVHGGRLTLHSTLGAGSTFAVGLPRAGQMT